MYIQYENQKYSCKCKFGKGYISYKDLPDDFPNSIEGEVVLCADDDFVLRIDNTKDYLIQIFENGTLTLTNTPQTEFVEEAEAPVSEIEQLRADIEFLALMTGVEL